MHHFIWELLQVTEVKIFHNETKIFDKVLLLVAS